MATKLYCQTRRMTSRCRSKRLRAAGITAKAEEVFQRSIDGEEAYDPNAPAPSRNYQGESASNPVIVDCGEWMSGGRYYSASYNQDTQRYETSEVSYCGCRFRCNVDHTSDTPGLSSNGWRLRDGAATFRLEISNAPVWCSGCASFIPGGVAPDVKMLVGELDGNVSGVYLYDVADRSKAAYEVKATYVRDLSSIGLSETGQTKTIGSTSKLTDDDIRQGGKLYPTNIAFKLYNIASGALLASAKIVTFGEGSVNNYKEVSGAMQLADITTEIKGGAGFRVTDEGIETRPMLKGKQGKWQQDEVVLYRGIADLTSTASIGTFLTEISNFDGTSLTRLVHAEGKCSLTSNGWDGLDADRVFAKVYPMAAVFPRVTYETVSGLPRVNIFLANKDGALAGGKIKFEITYIP